jgi:hypothetical protein
MEEYTPLIKDRDDDELIEIYLSGKGDWQEDALEQAKSELFKRGFTIDSLRQISLDNKNYCENEEKKRQEKLDKNATESYSIIKMICIFFASPIILSGRFRSIFGMSCSDLKRENYKIKFSQRLLLLIFGGLFWIILFNIGMTKFK